MNEKKKDSLCVLTNKENLLKLIKKLKEDKGGADEMSFTDNILSDLNVSIETEND